MKKNFILLLFLFAEIFTYPEARKYSTYKIDINEESYKINLSNKSGNISIGRWNKKYVEINVFILSLSWKGSNELKGIDIQIDKETENKLLNIKSIYNSAESDLVQVNYEINVPENVLINTIENLNGNIEINDANGDSFITASNGRISIEDHKGSLYLKNTNGKIILSNILGVCSSETNNGSISIEKITGDANITTTNGNIYIENIKGNLKVSSKGGDIYMEKIRGNIEAFSTYGDIVIDSSDGDASIQTESGDITAESVDGFINSMTNNGEIKIYDCKGIINAITKNGDIEAEIFHLKEEGCNIITDNGSIKAYIEIELNALLEVKNNNENINIHQTEIKFSKISNNHIKAKLGKGGPLISITSNNGRIKIYDL